MAAGIRCEDVSFAYGRVEALKGVTFSVAPGEAVFLVGPNASGKSTLLKLLHAQLRPQLGRVIVDGLHLERPRRGIVRHVRRRVGVVFQDYRLLERMTVLENVVYALRVSDLRLRPSDALARARAALGAVRMEARQSAYPRELSGGQQQRIAIARALANRPAVVLADEPTASLDDASSGRVLNLLLQLHRRGTTVVIATHDARLVGSVPHRVLRLTAGRIARDRAAR
jgi:cell division transport system ATP-binding protein